MKIAMIGTGYVGLVSGTCFAEMGNDVICVDKDAEKVKLLQNNRIPIYEPGLEELVKSNQANGRLSFTTDIKSAIESSLFIFIAVGTPTAADGSANLQYVHDVANTIGKYINGYKIIVDKSTVPIGTAEQVRKIILAAQQKVGNQAEFDMVSNPEFLKEGAAIADFMKPDRVVIGTDNVRTAELMKELYAPFVKNGHPIVTMDIKSAETTKYAANCMLAVRISFMNEIAKICEATGADVTKVREGIGTDSRIGRSFLYAGLGYGGSCFPKDVKALLKSFETLDMHSELLTAVENINYNQRKLFIEKISQHFEQSIQGKTIAVWGLAFKPNTDDVREAPALTIIDFLLAQGAVVQAYDPQAISTAREALGERENMQYMHQQYDVLAGADALVIVTEWNSFKRPDFDKIKALLNAPVIFDGRNLYEPSIMEKAGFQYYSIGR